MRATTVSTGSRNPRAREVPHTADPAEIQEGSGRDTIERRWEARNAPCELL